MSEKKNIVITGASSGIGKSIVKHLSQNQEYHLILIARNSNDLEKTASELKCVSYEIFSADLEIEEARKDLSKNILDKYGSIFWIIHSAGFVANDEKIDSETLSITTKTFEINFFSILHLTQLFYDKFLEDGGSIIISSSAGVSGSGFVPAYAASKGAVNNLTKSLALSWTDTGKRSVAICPGPTNTPMREKLAGDSAKHQNPDHIANLTLNVLDDPETYQNGSILIIRDGDISFLKRT